MAKNIWADNDEPVSEYEMVVEDAQQAEKLAAEYESSAPEIAEADEEALEEIGENAAFDLSREESNVVFNARLRLEQAKLYEMLINHNLFEGVDSSPEAIQNVQNEVKFYILKRLESLLGIRDHSVKSEAPAASTVELPFNDIELEFLKQLAYKGTLGASASGKPMTTQTAPARIKPVTQTKKVSLKPLSTKKPQVTKPEVVEQKQEPVKKETSKVKAKANPTRNTSTMPKVAESGMGRVLTPKEVEEIAKADLKASKKSFHLMTEKEKAERIREVNEKHKRPTSPKALALPTPSELEMKYRNQEANRSMSRSQTDQFNVILANALASQKHRGEEE